MVWWRGLELQAKRMEGSSPTQADSGGSCAIILLKDYAAQMKEGEELECQDVEGGSAWHFGKWGGELWVRGWDEYMGDYRWILYKM